MRTSTSRGLQPRASCYCRLRVQNDAKHIPDRPSPLPDSASAPAREAREFFTRLNHDYVRVHKAKEELFWGTYMAISDDHAGFSRAEQAYKAFISDPAKLTETRRHIAAVDAAAGAGRDGDVLHGLRGWLAMFEANVIEGGEASALMAQLVEAEAGMFAARQALVLSHVNDRGERQDATLASLATNQTTNPNEAWRRIVLRRVSAARALGPRARLPGDRRTTQPAGACPWIRQLLRLQGPPAGADDAASALRRAR